MSKNSEVISRQGRRKQGNLIECTSCHRFWPSTEFSPCKSVTSGLQPNCRSCLSIQGKKYRTTSGGKQKSKQRHNRWYKQNRKSRLLTMRSYLQELRAKVIQGYGGECECCGEKICEFLCIDHRNGDGKADRKQGLMGRAMYLHLIRNNYPRDRYRLLCHNCNMSYGLYGYCPHQRKHIETEAV